MNVRERGVGQLVRGPLAALAVGIVPFADSYASAQEIGATTTLIRGLQELERFAETAPVESSVLHVSVSRRVPGRFADLRGAPGVERSLADVLTPHELVAREVDSVYASFSLRERRHSYIYVTLFHTHPTRAMEELSSWFPAAFREVVEHDLPLTMPPSTSDIGRVARNGAAWRRITGLVEHAPPSRIRLQDAAVDETMTYFYRALSPSERRSMRLPAYSESIDAADYPALSAAALRITFFDQDARARFAEFSSIRNLYQALVANDPRLPDFYLTLFLQGDAELPEELRAEAEELRNLASGIRFDEVRTAWAVYVAHALNNGDSWDSILRSDEYRNLRDFYARYHNISLTAVPNEATDASTLRRLGYR